ncbi:2-amino-4-hydroxy-6-hydroxymethyldihydropteridine diphosphokinase [Gloeobacter kilaueensis]|uniref:2-amino-4-hydroxy-6-hydroxymethyldihydropteridine diphosphokinase n=1 Tax=Gloeobacter kilaueensis (strain ATCC BAA-2537 / CCAP 1431/1 / ULC 316 / JS1) TaxID=1183438 RepID=U5QMD4_GLOK1|nr:2-amino-4-hydroxy-6-hydroxymethyldihydropteridine diphosphokinase [Gloeobacter kilaueensis]AGY60081.1 2-amino-4-hydroxy-6-hydroxymethyldihydropteridine pyrophosphokinase [Gloeobacter kilaueensis JS1]
MARAAIALGANLGERFAVLTRAVRSLHRPAIGLEVKAISSWYETEPVGPPQPLYINGCLVLETSLSPLRLLAELQQREVEAGRVRTVHWGARTLDLDLLWYDDCVLASPELTLPHPRLEERAFVLVPLAEVAPDWQHPLTLKRLVQLRRNCDEQGVGRYTRRALVLCPLGPVDLRPLVREDFDALQALATRCWWQTYRGLLSDEAIESFIRYTYNLETIAYAAERADGRFWVAEDPAGGLIGFTQAVIAADRAHLSRLYVAPECQGLGLGTALWQLVRGELEAQGVQRCTLTVLNTNTVAIRFYEHLGFERTGPSGDNRYEYVFYLDSNV